jgi:hypothetical protein
MIPKLIANPCHPLLAAVLATLSLAFTLAAAQAQPVLLVTNENNNTVGAYNAVTGATINPAFIGAGQGLNHPWATALDNNGHLLVANAPFGPK